MVDAGDLGSTLLEQVVQGGVIYAAPIFIFSLLLFIQGAKTLPLTLGTAGFIVGYGMASQFIGQFSELGLSLTEEQFRLLCGVVIGVGAISVAQIASRMLAAGMVYLAVTRLITVGDGYGYDFEGDAFLSGILTLLAFIFSISFRRLVPAIIAAMIGSLGILFSVYITLGWDVARLDGAAIDVYLAIPLTLVSCYIQFKYFMTEDEDEEMDEEDKEYVF